ncbi:MepB family protein [Chryseobacterium daecheongense]|uniref:MepB family protein n=1 Tax=Chryseobacterium daecheongense TaxID=192389 RepID=UPI001FD68421|nr:MepB family protein [Chryseobacterium daecheongense]UOU97331.1 MepB family protein [Chryseobacterium daecheongense]
MNLKTVIELIFKPLGLICSDITEDPECKEYSGFNFMANHLKMKFRISKITPTKTGQFVTIWKRNENKETIPFEINDNFDFYLIMTCKDDLSGIFIFPKKTLSEKGVLSDGEKIGKRGIRVYPKWDYTENKQAKRTQEWQTKYFLEFSDDKETILQQAKFLLNI